MRIALLVVFVASLALAEERTLTHAQVPPAVLERVQAFTPGAKLLAFTLEEEAGQKRFEVTIEDRQGRADLVCDERGTLLTEERVVALIALPPTISAGLKRSTFAAATLVGVEKVTHVNEANRVEWELQVKTSEGAFELVFDARGSLVRSQKD